jgi:ActR/RegA family two-component response regulator
MLSDKPILIVQDNIYLALDLAAAVEQLAGRVVGPAASVNEALALLDSEPVAAALIDAELQDGIAPIARALVERGLPYVIQASAALGPEIMMIAATSRVLRKPIDPYDAVCTLAHQIEARPS